MAGDLHTHTTFSDGGCKIETLPFLAEYEGLKYISVTDHDTLECVKWAHEHNFMMNGVTLIPGVEISTEDKKRGRRVHILCYYPDFTTQLKENFAEMARQRNIACKKCLDNLQRYYPMVQDNALLPYRQDSGIMFKVHFMRVLMEYGYTDRIYGDLYNKLFGKNGDCLVNPPYDDIYYTLRMIKNARAVAVLAHPSVYDSIDLCRELCEQGLLDGVEIEHPRNKQEDKEKLRQLSKKYNLIVTGGTDFHGMNTKYPSRIGTCRTEDTEIEKIIALAKKRKCEE